ncbi:MAG: RidA family protein [Pyrinomonadaceae bacterium]
MKKPIILGDLKLPFSHAMRVGDLVFVSGQASVDLKTGDIIGGTFGEEFARSVDNLRTILAASGATLAEVIKVGCYVRRDEDLVEFNKLYRQTFVEPFPARTTITNCLPPQLLFEIDCVAQINNESSLEER